MKDPSPALRAPLRELVLELLEPASSRSTLEAERSPVPEDLASFLAEPFRRFSHQNPLGGMIWEKRMTVTVSSGTTSRL